MKRTRSNKKRQNQNQLFLGDVPQDIVSEILLLLPLKTLVRFKCVCKSWLYFISHPKFAKTHLQKSSLPTVHRLILREICPKSRSVKSHSTNYKKRDSYLLDIPTNDPSTSFLFIGSCNGLVCIFIRPLGVFLWNPFTRISKMLSSSWSIRFPHGQVYNFGFGYDLVNDDYKVVVIDWEGARIHSLKSGSCTELRGLPYYDYCDYRGENVDGVLHWMIGKQGSIHLPRVIVTINLSDETSGEIEVPCRGGENPRLGVLDGCLSYFCHFLNQDNNFCFHIWVMKEYGVKDTWTKLYTFINLCTDFGYPMCITVTGEIVLKCTVIGKMLFYNPTNHTSRRMNIGRWFTTNDAITYVESLVSPNIDDEVLIP